MRLLVTAGNTQTPLDSVRCITNIFTGRTGARIAAFARQQGHEVTVLTSHPLTVTEAVADLGGPPIDDVRSYVTFDDLHGLLAHELQHGRWDALVHCAAVSDFRPAGVFGLAPGAEFDAETRTFRGTTESPWQPAHGGKISSHERELWVRLIPTPKLVDQVRSAWKFNGVLVKFKLEVNVTQETLATRAEQARTQSQADLLVANTLEGYLETALIGPIEGKYHPLTRAELPAQLVRAIEQLHAQRTKAG